VKRIKRSVAKVMVAGALSAAVGMGAAGIASAVVGSGGITTGTGKTLADAEMQAASLCDSGAYSQVQDTWQSGGYYYVNAICA
jgi:hypothetical protein